MDREVGQLAEALRGKFIVFDGPDGAGKSTQRERFAEALRQTDVEIVSCRDPGGTEIGERIRRVLLDHDLSAMDVHCETLLFMASRAQLLADVVRPALAKRAIVLCDRFISSTCAYQGAAGMALDRVIELGRWTLDDGWPDLTVVLDVDAEVGLERIGRRPHHAGRNRRRSSGEGTLFEGSQPDAMEARSIEFHRRVREVFLELPSRFPTPVVVVDGCGDVEVVQRRILDEVRRAFG